MSSQSDANAGAAVADEWVIEPEQHGVIARARELWAYRYLWWYFASLTTRSLYRRSSLGWIWLLVRVTGPIGISSLFFGGVLDVKAEGNPPPPYFLFFLCGTATWLLFERSLLFITRSIERNRRLITKVYFPRMILPMAAIAPGLLYLGILLIVLIGSTFYYRHHDGIWYITLTPRLFAAAGAVAMSGLMAIAVGLWTSVLQARYRDIRFGIRYFSGFWFYFTPISYPLSMFPAKYRWIASLNPMTHVVELFKWGTLGQSGVSMPGVITSMVLITATMVSGMWFFNRQEAGSVDKL